MDAAAAGAATGIASGPLSDCLGCRNVKPHSVDTSSVRRRDGSQAASGATNHLSPDGSVHALEHARQSGKSAESILGSSATSQRRRLADSTETLDRHPNRLGTMPKPPV